METNSVKLSLNIVPPILYLPVLWIRIRIIFGFYEPFFARLARFKVLMSKKYFGKKFNANIINAEFDAG
jgi:hypothetical protein